MKTFIRKRGNWHAGPLADSAAAKRQAPYLRAAFAAALLCLLAAGCAHRAPGDVSRRDSADPVAAGFRADAFAAFDQILERMVEDERRVPGAVLSVARNGVVVYERAAGVRDLGEGKRPPVTRETLFDVASLAKPVVTASTAALLVCRGELDPATRLAGEPIDRILRHATRLPAYIDWQDLVRAGEDAPLDETLAALLPPPKTTLSDGVQLSDTASSSLPHPAAADGYSNTAYLLLSSHLEKMLGRDLESFLAAELWGPLGMTRTTYRPQELANAEIARTDRRIEPGRPYDPLAAYVVGRRPGHVPGHSGLFSTAGDLSRFCQALLHPATARVPDLACAAELLFSDHDLVPMDTADGGAVALAPHTAGRTFGFERRREWPGGQAYFHTGYTGCLIWLDRATGTSVVLLTNSTLDEPAGWQEVQRRVLYELRRGIVPER